MKSLIKQNSPASCYFLPHKPKYCPQTPPFTQSVQYVASKDLLTFIYCFDIDIRKNKPSISQHNHQNE